MELFQISRYVHHPNIITIDTILIDAPQPFTVKFPQADIHELLTLDLLHQAVKGMFKDHLVQWVEDYLKLTHGPVKTDSILDEIDRQYVISQTNITYVLCIIPAGRPSATCHTSAM